MPEELAAFGATLQFTTQQRIGDADFFTGTLAGVPMVWVQCGIGKVNSAFAATVLCEKFGVKQIIFSGIAGGIDPSLQVGDVVIADSLIQYDYGRWQQGKIMPYRPGIPPIIPSSDDIAYLLTDHLRERIAAAIKDVPLPPWQGCTTHWRFGKILTGDVFLNDSAQRAKLFTQFGAQAIEMEGAAIAQIAEKFGAAPIIIRALSDLAGDDSHLDFKTFAQHAALMAAQLVAHIAQAIN